MRVLITFFLIFSIPSFSAKIGTKKPNLSSIRIVPVRPTPEPTNIQTKIVFPQEQQVLWSNPVRLQVRLIGFNVGTKSDFDRAKEVFNDPDGQSLLVFIDDKHPLEIYRSSIDSLDNNNLFYDINLTKSLPFYLKEGMHVIRAFPDRSYGESLKGPGCYAAGIFYIGSKIKNFDFNLNEPYLTYNEPLETIQYSSNKPILLDFYLSNIQLSRDGFKVKITINNDVVRSLTDWVPYYIYGLSKGKHTIRLQLIDEKNNQVTGRFNDVSRTIIVN